MCHGIGGGVGWQDGPSLARALALQALSCSAALLHWTACPTTAAARADGQVRGRMRIRLGGVLREIARTSALAGRARAMNTATGLAKWCAGGWVDAACTNDMHLATTVSVEEFDVRGHALTIRGYASGVPIHHCKDPRSRGVSRTARKAQHSSETASGGRDQLRWDWCTVHGHESSGAPRRVYASMSRERGNGSGEAGIVEWDTGAETQGRGSLAGGSWFGNKAGVTLRLGITKIDERTEQRGAAKAYEVVFDMHVQGARFG
ncbi:hypothetical protein BDN71DRAFT_1435957 [Pleurotus eryngii]|uniref:Uncharacterized protein n=1 Tax=Pleurotus eryngii TaxID=5323 RepID=A0A9P5ZKD2_PLEER|nr:hypothetical protein BDN71DRAFT_1435957 [Pleurotus eryngii]